MKKVTLGVVVLIALYGIGSMMGQLQQSGGPGSSVTLQPGSNVAGKFGIDQTTPGTTNGVSLASIGSAAVAAGNGVSGAGVQRVAIASDQTAFSVNAVVSSGLVNTVPKTSCGNTVAAGSTLAAVPTSSTLITSAATACVIAIITNNTTASPVTITVTDNTATPVNALLTFSIPAFSQLIQPLYGAAFNLGVKWSASGAGVTGALVAYQ